MSSSEYYTFLGTTCDWKCHNSVENENIFSCDNEMLDYFVVQGVPGHTVRLCTLFSVGYKDFLDILWYIVRS